MVSRDAVSLEFSDLGVYEYLASIGLNLYIHPRIHLKLFVFEFSRPVMSGI